MIYFLLDSTSLGDMITGDPRSPDPVGDGWIAFDERNPYDVEKLMYIIKDLTSAPSWLGCDIAIHVTEKGR